jgi:S1-C subfamily serine protease
VIAIASQRGDGSAKAAPVRWAGLRPSMSTASAIYESLLARESRESPWIASPVLRMSRESRRAAGAPDSIGIQVDNVFAPSPAASLRDQDRRRDHAHAGRGHPPPCTISSRILYAAGVGQEITLELVRKGTRLERTIHIDKRPPEAITR